MSSTFASINLGTLPKPALFTSAVTPAVRTQALLDAFEVAFTVRSAGRVSAFPPVFAVIAFAKWVRHAERVRPG
jgi:hypothetical protein